MTVGVFHDRLHDRWHKQVLTALRDDTPALSDLLADDVQIYAPILGPLKKKEVSRLNELGDIFLRTFFFRVFFFAFFRTWYDSAFLPFIFFDLILMYYSVMAWLEGVLFLTLW